MKATDLIKGNAYVLLNGTEAIYQGKHADSDLMELSDGTTLMLAGNALVFHTTDADGRVRTILLESGANVKETVATRDERLRMNEEKRAREIAAVTDAVQRATTITGGRGVHSYSNTDVVTYREAIAKGAVQLQCDYHLHEDGTYRPVWTVTMALDTLHDVVRSAATP